MVFTFVFCFEIRDSTDLSTVLYKLYDKTDIMYNNIISITFKQLNIE